MKELKTPKYLQEEIRKSKNRLSKYEDAEWEMKQEETNIRERRRKKYANYVKKRIKR